MAKPISDYTVDELSAKIEAIKAEREKTANALKMYEEELERRQEVPLGVPDRKRNKAYWKLTGSFEIKYSTDENDEIDNRFFEVMNYFHSSQSAQKHADMLFEWRKDGLIANAKGEPIDIKVLLPLLKKGWVAMDETGFWYWHKNKPSKREEDWRAKDDIAGDLVAFNLKPADDWRESLMECGL